MKKLMITCFLVGAASVVSFAQATPGSKPQAPGASAATMQQHAGSPISPNQMAERRAKMDEKEYSLTPEQYKGVYDIELEFAKSMEQYRAQGQQPGIGQRNNLLARKDAKMKAVLTPEQFAKYDAARNKERMAPMAPPPPPPAK